MKALLQQWNTYWVFLPAFYLLTAILTCQIPPACVDIVNTLVESRRKRAYLLCQHFMLSPSMYVVFNFCYSSAAWTANLYILSTIIVS